MGSSGAPFFIHVVETRRAMSYIQTYPRLRRSLILTSETTETSDKNISLIEVFSFENPIHYVLAAFEHKKKKNDRFSIRAWSKQLGFANPSFLSDVLRGRRKLQIGLAEKIALNLKLPEDQRRYFEILVLRLNSRSELERSVYSTVLDSLKMNAGPKAPAVPQTEEC
jgi:hypothetical protein